MAPVMAGHAPSAIRRHPGLSRSVVVIVPAMAARRVAAVPPGIGVPAVPFPVPTRRLLPPMFLAHPAAPPALVLDDEGAALGAAPVRAVRGGVGRLAARPGGAGKGEKTQQQSATHGHGAYPCSTPSMKTADRGGSSTGYSRRSTRSVIQLATGRGRKAARSAASSYSSVSQVSKGTPRASAFAYSSKKASRMPVRAAAT